MADEKDQKAEKPEGKAGDGDVTMTDAERITAEYEAKLKSERDAREAAERKFEQTKTERSEEREKRQREAEKNQQYEEAKKLQDEKLAEMEAELEKLRGTVAELEPAKAEAEKWQAYEQKKRDALLEEIPEDVRSVYENTSLDVLEATVSQITGKKPGTFTGGASHKPTSTKSKWSEMDDATRAQKARELDTDELAKLIAAG